MFTLRVYPTLPQLDFELAEFRCLIQHLGTAEFSMALFLKRFHGFSKTPAGFWSGTLLWAAWAFPWNCPKLHGGVHAPNRKQKADYWIFFYFLPIWHKLWARNWPLSSIGITDRVTNFLTRPRSRCQKPRWPVFLVWFEQTCQTYVSGLLSRLWCSSSRSLFHWPTRKLIKKEEKPTIYRPALMRKIYSLFWTAHFNQYAPWAQWWSEIIGFLRRAIILTNRIQNRNFYGDSLFEQITGQ